MASHRYERFRVDPEPNLSTPAAAPFDRAFHPELPESQTCSLSAFYGAGKVMRQRQRMGRRGPLHFCSLRVTVTVHLIVG
jgi:hypothetical protein